MSNSYKIGDRLDIKIEKIVPRGFGIGFAEKLTVLVPLAAPGDSVRVEIREVKKRLAFAELIEVLEPGPERIVPPCPIFGICGGCDFQQLSYQAQLEAKVGIIRDCLTRIGKIDFTGEIDIIGSPMEFDYRSRARWHIDREKKVIGYRKRNSHEVVDITGCPIAAPELKPVPGALHDKINWELIFEDAEIEAAAGDNREVSIWSSEFGAAPATVEAEFAGHTYQYNARTFFQANKSLTPKLIETAIGNLAGAMALDLYCGVGLFTLPLAQRFTEVTGVEGHRPSLDLAKKNAEAAGLSNVEFFREGVGQFLSTVAEQQIDLVLIDPPRAGTEPGVVRRLAELRPKHISYISCEPSILARDLREFLDAGYSIVSITALDMFPQTHHVETVVHLEKN